ncbi:SDR family oxidoreductase [Acinetobacter boissieri]|uniref:NAD(P)-dependent dehydrogenase, short-chain alcohol dehydrogenase family n=1 Tax=Acinetobacter boissieri TaxID=1219383 RepID=A0A1G6KGR5_9GAMM|nr:SDR family oxidoreductase [Acinetobacter boissieri]SDC30001.1 NAD(P)-dependent dehydrogenase, short-chain alcohol dehydrogenase family [Acinetobacter boissieri]
MINKFNIHAQKQEFPGSDTDLNPPAEFISKDYFGSKKLEGKVALITGGDSGIGRSAAFHFIKEGAEIAITYMKGYESERIDAEWVKKWAENEGGICKIYPVDLRNSQECVDLIKHVLLDFSKINILVNNAGTQYPNEDLSTLSDEQWLNTFATNVHSMFYLTKATLPHLEQGDVIINTSSVNGYLAPGNMVDYSTTKGAQISFTRSLSNQLLSRGIRVNAIAPGPVWTPLQPATLGQYNPEFVENYGGNSPMERCAQPSEIGPSFVLLASADSSYITGQTIHPNGGMMVGG